MTRTVANLLLLLVGAVWGFTFIAQSEAMDDLGPFLFIAARFSVAALVLLPFALFESSRARKPLTGEQRGIHLGIGVILFFGMALQQVGLLTTTVTNSGFLTSLYVVLVPVLGVVILRQWPHPIVWPCALLAIAGIYLLSGGALARLVVGDLYTIACAAVWALHVLCIGRFAQAIGRPFALATTQLAVAAVLGLAIALVTEPIAWAPIRAAAWEILFAAVLGSSFAFTLQIIGQRYTTAPQAAIFLSSESLFAAAFGALLLGERVGLTGLAGCGLIFVAMLLVEVVPGLRARRKTSVRIREQSVT